MTGQKSGDPPTTLYRLFDAAGELLYVGISGNWADRFGHHANHQSWWPHVAKITLEVFPTRPEAAKAEAAAIEQEHPRYNRRPGHRPAWEELFRNWPGRRVLIDWGSMVEHLGTPEHPEDLDKTIAVFIPDNPQEYRKAAANPRAYFAAIANPEEHLAAIARHGSKPGRGIRVGWGAPQPV